MSGPAHYLVVGSGSIARRHIANLKTLFPHSIIGCISSSGKSLMPSDVGADVIYSGLKEAVQNPLKFAVVATPAPFHVQQAAELLKNGIHVLIEKPLADCLASFKKEDDLLFSNQDKIEIAYNLRYMSSAVYLKKLLVQGILGKIHSVLIDVGQYLPDWRPQTDYRKNVSGKKALGGGVLLELSHELDYLIWLFGHFDSVFCMTKTSGSLDIDVEDIADAIITRHDGLMVNVHMDFLQHRPSRTCKIVGDLGTLSWNLLTNQIKLCHKKDEEKIVFDEPDYDRNKMYLDELSRFAKVAEGALSPAIDMKQGLMVLRLIEAMKQSALTHQMVSIDDVSQYPREIPDVFPQVACPRDPASSHQD